MNLTFVKDNIKHFDQNTSKILGGGYTLYAWINEIHCLIRYGCSPDDYFRYEFYRKSGLERNKFITWRRSQRLIKQYNDPAFTEIFHDKRKFNETFAEYIEREWLDLGQCNAQTFEAFVQKHGAVLIKPLDGGQGKGIYKLSQEELNSFKLVENTNCIAEQIIPQHHLMAELNASSVNTVRVLTFKGKAIAAALRIGGSGAVVDNLHSNGVCAHLDLETGMIDSPCINNKLEKYLFHPDTHIQLVGYRVPNWDRIIETAQKAAQVVPQVQYVGWDIAVTESGTALIEGNHDPGHDVVQMIAQTGLYSEIRKLEKQ